MSMAIAIAAYNMKNDAWAQANYFSGDTTLEGPLWDIFTKGGKRISGLTFNDVVVKFDDNKGVEGSVPAQIMFDTHPEMTIEVAADDIVNVKGEKFLTQDARLRAVAVLIDNATGAILNSNKSEETAVSNGAGVDDVYSVGEVVATEYYDLQGRRLSKPVPGQLVVKAARLSDGSTRQEKVIM
mgnify:CR=1 FL=1